MAHLHTETGSMPYELLILRLCREFHVLPSALEAEPWENISHLLTCMRIENQVENLRRRL
jgi:hypothetical protein